MPGKMRQVYRSTSRSQALLNSQGFAMVQVLMFGVLATMTLVAAFTIVLIQRKDVENDIWRNQLSGSVSAVQYALSTSTACLPILTSMNLILTDLQSQKTYSSGQIPTALDISKFSPTLQLGAPTLLSTQGGISNYQADFKFTVKNTVMNQVLKRTIPNAKMSFDNSGKLVACGSSSTGVVATNPFSTCGNKGMIFSPSILRQDLFVTYPLGNTWYPDTDGCVDPGAFVGMNGPNGKDRFTGGGAQPKATVYGFSWNGTVYATQAELQAAVGTSAVVVVNNGIPSYTLQFGFGPAAQAMVVVIP